MHVTCQVHVYFCVIIFTVLICGATEIEFCINMTICIIHYKANKKVSCKNIHKCRDGAASH